MATTQPAGVEKVSGEDSMVASSLIWWGGPAAILGGVLSFLVGVLSILGVLGNSYNSVMQAPLSAANYTLGIVGIMGIYLYLRRSGRFGLSGTVGFYMCVWALLVLTILSLGDLLNVWGARWYEALGLLWSPWVNLGLVLFGVAILRAGRLSRGGAWLLIAFSITEVGAIVAMAISGYTLGGWVWNVPSVVFGLGFVWLGYGLWSESGASAGRPSRVS